MLFFLPKVCSFYLCSLILFPCCFHLPFEIGEQKRLTFDSCCWFPEVFVIQLKKVASCIKRSSLFFFSRFLSSFSLWLYNKNLGGILETTS